MHTALVMSMAERRDNSVNVCISSPLLGSAKWKMDRYTQGCVEGNDRPSPVVKSVGSHGRDERSSGGRVPQTVHRVSADSLLDHAMQCTPHWTSTQR